MYALNSLSFAGDTILSANYIPGFRMPRVDASDLALLTAIVSLYIAF